MTSTIAETDIGKIAITPRVNDQEVYDILDLIVVEGRAYLSLKIENTAPLTDPESWMKVTENSYDIAVRLGYEGTEEEWLASLSAASDIAAEEARKAIDECEAMTGTAETAAENANKAAGRANNLADYPPRIINGEWWFYSEESNDYYNTGQPAKGKDFTILGYFATPEELESSITDPSEGDSYGVGAEAPYDIYIYDGLNNVWVNNGKLEGAQGKSAYEIWLENGHTGSEEDFIEWCKGKDGYTPQKGIDYFDGKSAYNAYQQEGGELTEEEFNKSLRPVYNIPDKFVEGFENITFEEVKELIAAYEYDYVLYHKDATLSNIHVESNDEDIIDLNYVVLKIKEGTVVSCLIAIKTNDEEVNIDISEKEYIDLDSEQTITGKKIFTSDVSAARVFYGNKRGDSDGLIGGCLGDDGNIFMQSESPAINMFRGSDTNYNVRLVNTGNGVLNIVAQNALTLNGTNNPVLSQATGATLSTEQTISGVKTFTSTSYFKDSVYVGAITSPGDGNTGIALGALGNINTYGIAPQLTFCSEGSTSSTARIQNSSNRLLLVATGGVGVSNDLYTNNRRVTGQNGVLIGGSIIDISAETSGIINFRYANSSTVTSSIVETASGTLNITSSQLRHNGDNVATVAQTPRFGTVKTLNTLSGNIELDDIYDVRFNYSGTATTITLGQLSGGIDGSEYILSVYNSGTGLLTLNMPTNTTLHQYDETSVAIPSKRIGELSIRYIFNKYVIRIIGE